MSWLSDALDWVAEELLGIEEAKKPVPPKPVKASQSAPRVVGGASLNIRVDASIPQSILFGRCVTSGSLVYAETFGKRGEIDNAQLIEIISLADHPCEGLVQVYVEERQRSLDGSGNVSGYSSGGVDLLNVEFKDGTQNAADGLTVTNLGTHTKRPWTAAMIGRRRTYVRIRSRYDPDKVPGQLPWKFVVDGIKLYDPRQDSTAGGSGAHRFTTISTHEHTRNLAVICYNILRGIYVLDADNNRQHIYGLEGLDASQLPYAVWAEAMDACDELISGNRAYWGGGEVPVTSEPREAIREILKACGGRLAEFGGVYKLFVGPPTGTPALSFTDEFLLADEGDTYSVITPLENRINHITGSYTRPEDGWIERVAPPRANAAAEAADGRRITADLDVPWVQHGSHMQRLMKQLLARARKQRRHILPFPPAAFGLEPCDIISWTSTRNGYIDKQFLVEQVDVDANFRMTVACIEIDETDYDWTEGTDLVTEADASIVVDRPDPVESTGFAVLPYTQTTVAGLQYPGIQLTWDDPEDNNVIAVRVAIRFAGDSNSANYSYRRINDPLAEAAVMVGGFQPNTDYEVQAWFETQTGRAADKSAWLAVTTPDVRISQDQLDDAINDFFEANAAITEIAAIFQENAFGKTSAEIQFRNAAVPADISGAAAGARISLLVRAAISEGVYPAFDGTMAAFHLDAFTDGVTRVARAVFDVDRFVINAGAGQFLPIFETYVEGGDRFITMRASTVRLQGNLFVEGSINANRLNIGGNATIKNGTINFLNGQQLSFDRIDANTINVANLQTADLNQVRTVAFSGTTGGVQTKVLLNMPLDEWTKAVIVTGYCKVRIEGDKNDTTTSTAKVRLQIGSYDVIPRTPVATTNIKAFTMMFPLCGVAPGNQLANVPQQVVLTMSHGGKGRTKYAGRIGLVGIRV